MARQPSRARPTGPARQVRRHAAERAREPEASVATSMRTPARAQPASAARSVAPELAAKLNFVSAAPGGAQIHDDAAANALASAHAANAVTIGRDIYFAQGAYAPDTVDGRARLAHELTHVDQYMRGALQGRGPGVVPDNDPLEREAASAESAPPQATTARDVASAPPVPPPSSPDALPRLRQPEPADLLFPLGVMIASSLGPAAPHLIDPFALLLAADWDPETEIDLQGLQYLPDLPAFRAYVAWYGPALLRVRFGSFAHGHIALHEGCYGDHHALYTDLISELWMSHPTLPDVPDQRMAIAVVDDEIFGAVGRVEPSGVVAMDTQIELTDWRDDYGPALLELPDYRDTEPPALLTNAIDACGNLQFAARDYHFELPGPGDSRHDGSASLTLDNAAGTVTARATIEAPGLGDGDLTLRRLPNGSFTGTATMSVGPFGDARGGHAGFSGTLTVTYGRQLLDVVGTVRYDGARISGTGTLRLTDAESAWAAARTHIVAAVGTMPASTEPSTGLALTGWGTMEYRFGEWLRGRASVVVAPDGHIYSRGEIRPTANIRFLDPPRRWRRRIAGPFEASHDVFEALLVNIEAGGSVELWGSSTFGPGQIHRLRLVGAFSTNTQVPWQLEIGGTISLAASAELELIARIWIEGKLAHVVTPVDISATIRGHAALRADAEATATIGRRLRGDDPEAAEYFIQGDFSAQAALAAGLRGSIDFGLLGSGWNLWRSDDHEWPIGSVRLERHLEYTFGRAETGNVSVEAPAIEASASDLISGLARRSVPSDVAARQRSEVDGRFRSSEAASVTPYPEVGPQPHAPAVEEPPLPAFVPTLGVPDSADSSAGGADAGVGGAPAGDASGQDGRDAGVPPIAGVPPQPEPRDIFPEAPGRVAAEFDDDTRIARFSMRGVQHRLRLIPAQPEPRLIMESAPDDLTDKLDSEIAEQSRDGDSDEVTALQSIKTEAEQVVADADALRFGDEPNVAVPELQPLADRIERFADQFDERDLNDGLPEAAITEFDPDVADPDNTLELPWDDFVARVQALPPVDALILLDAQHDYLQGEIRDVAAWLGRHQRHESGYQAAQGRYLDLTGRLAWVFQQRRRYRLELNPNERVALPCFPAGTLVHTPSGLRAIESLAIGDDVWSADPETGMVVAGQVEGVFVHRAVDLFDIHTAGESVSATGAHPFWEERSQAWVAAAALRPGMALRSLAGETVPVCAVERRSIAAASTFNLALGPFPTYFVGMGLLVHNGSYGLWQTYPWASQHNFKIYVGLNDSDEFRQYVYVGQTKQAIATRERQHRDEANRKLAQTDLTPEARLFYRFKQGMRLTAICDGLKGESAKESNQARYLEQKNINLERNIRGEAFVLNQIEASVSLSRLNRLIREDQEVTDAGYCLTPAVP